MWPPARPNYCEFSVTTFVIVTEPARADEGGTTRATHSMIWKARGRTPRAIGVFRPDCDSMLAGRTPMEGIKDMFQGRSTRRGRALLLMLAVVLVASALCALPAGARTRGNAQPPVVVDHLDGAATVLGDSSTAQATPAAGPAPAARFPRRAAVVMLVPKNYLPNYTPEGARAAMFTGDRSVDKFYREEYGLTGPAFTGDVLGPWEVDMSLYTQCDYYSWIKTANTVASQRGVNLSGYDHVIVAPVVQTFRCGYAGAADLGTSAGLGRNAVALMALDANGLAVHEIGHNLGLKHAGALACWDASNAVVAISDRCASGAYDDPADVMGDRGTRHWNAGHKRIAGILPAANVQRVTGSGEFTLTNSERVVAGATQLIEIPRSDGSTYQLELRAPYGTFDNFARIDREVRGVSIRVLNWPSPGGENDADTNIIDTTPGSRMGFGDAPLLPGRSFVDNGQRIKVTTLSVTNGVARVRIERGTFASPTASTRVEIVNGVLTVNADPVHSNDVMVQQTDKKTVYVASWGGIAAGSSCTALSDVVAVCSATAKKAKLKSLVVNLGDGMDYIWPEVSIPYTINGGGEDDWLTSGLKGGTINGGAGYDVLFGGKADRLDCGPDGGVAYLVGPKAKSVTNCTSVFPS
jgi:hypothetical protein